MRSAANKAIQHGWTHFLVATFLTNELINCISGNKMTSKRRLRNEAV